MSELYISDLHFGQVTNEKLLFTCLGTSVKKADSVLTKQMGRRKAVIIFLSFKQVLYMYLN